MAIEPDWISAEQERLIRYMQKDNGIVYKNSIHHPLHYTQGSKEVIDMMVDIWGKESVAIYCEINAFKYRMRAGYKGNAVEDIEKSKFYMNKRLELLKQD